MCARYLRRSMSQEIKNRYKRYGAAHDGAAHATGGPRCLSARLSMARQERKDRNFAPRRLFALQHCELGNEKAIDYC